MDSGDLTAIDPVCSTLLSGVGCDCARDRDMGSFPKIREGKKERKKEEHVNFPRIAAVASNGTWWHPLPHPSKQDLPQKTLGKEADVRQCDGSISWPSRDGPSVR